MFHFAYKWDDKMYSVVNVIQTEILCHYSYNFFIIFSSYFIITFSFYFIKLQKPEYRSFFMYCICTKTLYTVLIKLEVMIKKGFENCVQETRTR